MNYETLIVTLKDGIAHVQINRPDKANAMSLAVWHEIRTAFNWIDAAPEARVAVISGSGAHFTSGIDLQMMMNLGTEIQDDCDGRTREKLRRTILDLQDTLSSIERCRKPVLAAVHGACIGGGVDLICACDMRYCSADAYFIDQGNRHRHDRGRGHAAAPAKTDKRRHGARTCLHRPQGHGRGSASRPGLSTACSNPPRRCSPA